MNKKERTLSSTANTLNWRALIFIPADNEKFIAKAHLRGADACILDLEDSIPVVSKARARKGLPDAAAQIKNHGTDVLVRINAESVTEDLIAAARASVSAVVLPKVTSATTVLQAAAQLDVLEQLREIPLGQIGLIAQIEDVAALPHLKAIAQASWRLRGMSLGSEDFSASAGMQPTPEALYSANQQIVFACRESGISPLGFPASIALFEDLDVLSDAARRGAQMGFTGAFCIHPAQVPILNHAFTPDPEAVAEAQNLLAAFNEAETAGKGVFSWHGKMIDRPVILRAKTLVKRAEAIAQLQPTN